MGREESPLVWYYQENENFAKLVDGWLFHGEGRIRPEDVSGMDRRFMVKRGRRAYRERYRDLYKKVGGAVFRLLIGIEAQSHVHYAMPVRVMDYVSTSYTAQKAAISSRHEKLQDLREDEWLSEFSKDDRLMPVISLVLYWGLRPWDGAQSLYELLDFRKVPKELKKYVADYRICVLDVCHTPDERLREFPADIQVMFLFFKYRNDPEGLKKSLGQAGSVRSSTYDTIADCVGEQRLKRYRQEKEERQNMCRAIDMLIADGEKKGEERGRKQGFELGVEQERARARNAWEKAEQERARARSAWEKAEQERARAERAEARVRELEKMLEM